MAVWAQGGQFSPMTALTAPFRDPRRALLIGTVGIAAAAILALAGQALVAQITGDRGIAAVASSGDILIGGIEVDVTGKTASEAREEGWREAMRLAWKKAGGPAIPDGQLYSLVSSVVVESEELGANRYVARLGVVFDRARAGGLLGKGGQVAHSAPMLLVPVTFAAGTQTVYEVRNPWQRAWAEYQPGASTVDYVRPSGANGNSLLMTWGQVGRRSRTWWRNVLDQFGASDVLVAIAHLEYQYPGGPVKGTFTARFGPDNLLLGKFSMTAPSQAELPAMLDRAVLQTNTIFEQAFAEGKLKPDPTLNLGAPQIDPAIQRLIDMGRAAEADEAAAARAAAAAAASASAVSTPEPAAGATPAPAAMGSYMIQFATPNAGAFDASLAAVRATPGVRAAAATSTAIGGTSLMSVVYGSTANDLAAALRTRGFTVRQSGNSISISR